MNDMLLIGLYALAGRRRRRRWPAPGRCGCCAGRSILVHVLVLLAVTVLAVVAGVATVARAMFLSGHDL